MLRIAGMDVVADWGLLIMFALVTVSLALGLLPAWHPQWSTLLTWVTALAAALLFLTSVLVHELSHAVVGRRGGVHVRRIILFIFGGIAQTENEAPSWQVELRMALAGPLVSLLIGAGCLALVETSVGAAELTEGQVQQFLAALNPGATILLWLGWINIILGIFNLVPGFPLDGGRALRAVIWALTGDLRRSTRFASLLGQAFAWTLIGLGIAMVVGARVPFFGQGPVSGLWLALIGLFLNNAALMSYRHLLISDALKQVPVSRLMRVTSVALDPKTPVGTFVERYAMASGQDIFPIEQDGHFLGLVALADVNRFQRAVWHATTLADVMTPASRLVALSPKQSASDAIGLMGRYGVDHLPVLEGERFLGVLSREDVLKWMSLRLDRERDEEQPAGGSSTLGHPPKLRHPRLK